ncbi:methyltransferase domain-containing protein [Sphingosinicella sp. BN140058]|uniref:methyltransferase domain-containing protein n=1 Tax=Sphingosinicella sp. BN140058 TaxID=1892855 RepID=UPI001010A316|nr:methyltransferase domain-containing protein [Sphingosinicella sp. BN140058]QAY77063.1 methyltransferase domain-containing protein [Sphingosinicella sp. BN140058]
MRSLARRAIAEEQMDDPGLPEAVYDAVLSDLGRINRWTLAARPTLGFLRRVTRGRDQFSLLDVGFGDGGMLRLIARWAKRAGKSAELVGVDLNPKSAAVAAAATSSTDAIAWRTGDYRDQGGFDIVISSLVAHHMDDAELRRFLRWMEANTMAGWLVNDLHRHRLAYAGYPLLARLLGVHRIVREDGQLSIARAYRPAEWRSIIDEIGLAEAQVVRRFPFRLCVERLR